MSAPEFRALWERARAQARRRGLRRRRARAAGIAIAVSGAALWLAAEPAPQDSFDSAELARISREIETWQGPLDFLLQTPGRERLEELPRLGNVSTAPWVELETTVGGRTSS